MNPLTIKAVGWHSELAKWARTVAHFLKADGKFCFAEFHPVLWMLSDDHSKILHSYFQSGAIIEENVKSYADPDSGDSVQWRCRFIDSTANDSNGNA